MMTKQVPFIVVLLAVSLIAMFTWAAESATGKRTLSPPQPRIIDPAFFGIHFHRLKIMPGEKAVDTVWPPLKFGILRLWDSRTRWANIEPVKGEWHFERFDYYVDEAVAHNAKVLYTLGSTPQWASARPTELCGYHPNGCAAEPKSMDDWREYVRVVARRYRGRICCYEVWNEPDFSGPPKDPKKAVFFTGGVGDMVKMAQIARQVLEEEDPAAVLFSPAFVNGVDNRLEPFLAAGGRNLVQGIAYHFYAWNDESRMLREIDAVRAAMKKHGLDSLPLWNTEAGVEVHAPGTPLPKGSKIRISREEGAAMMVRQIVLAAYAGLERYIYYSWDHEIQGMVDRAGHAYPARDAMILLQRWLLGARLDRCDIQEGHPTLCWGERSGILFAIVWNASSTDALEVPVPTGLRIVGRQVAVPRWTGSMPKEIATEAMLATANPTFYTFERIERP